jgi:hypothetical protein
MSIEVPAASTSLPELTPDQEEKIERWVDQGVGNQADIERGVLGYRRIQEAAGRVIGDGASEVVVDRPKTHHYSRRGGRSFPEPSDSESDPNWNIDTQTSMTAEELRDRDEGIALLRAVEKYLETPDLADLSKEERIQAVDEFIKRFREERHEPSS